MPTFALLCLSPDPQLREQLLIDLSCLRSHFLLLAAATPADADRQLAALQSQGQAPAVLIHDGHWPQEVAILARSHAPCRLLALPEHGLQADELHRTVTGLASQFVMAHPQADLLDYVQVLDQRSLVEAHVDRKLAEYREGFMDYTHDSDETVSQQVLDGLLRFFAERDEGHACRRYSPGHVLTREGERNDFLWLIASGEVVLRKRDESGVEQEVVRYQGGALVGGMSFVTGEPAFTTGITLAHTDVIKLDKRLFAEVMGSQSDLLPAFTNLLLRHFNRRLQNSINTKMELQRTLHSLNEAYRQLVENEKMVMLGQLVAGVAHELNNPVSAIIRGSATLSELIPDLVNLDLQPEHKTLGNLTLCRAMQVQALSTSVQRERARQAEGRFGDRQQARLAVKMRLDDEVSWRGWFSLLSGPERDALLSQLEQFHEAGMFLRNIEVCARRIGDLVRSLKQYVREDSRAPVFSDLHEGLEDTLMIFENRLKQHEVVREYQDLPHLRCYPGSLQQVWTNLLANALDAMTEPGTLSVRTAQPEPGWVTVEIEDSGCGIEAERLPHIFELNHTTKREGHFGLGIGLSVCQQVVQQHRGRIEVNSTPGQGTCMQVWLPLGGPDDSEEDKA